MNTDRLFLVLVPLLRGTARSKRRKRLGHFESDDTTPGAVVFLGDSITEGGPWDAVFPGLPVVNRGIGWDTTQDVLDRLERSINQPAVVSLLVGTNDLHTSRRLKDPAGIAARLEMIVERIRVSAPEAQVLINGVMPRTAYFASRIQAVNERYREVATRTGSVYVDTWPVLSNDADAIRAEFTTDNLHLTQDGYRAWGDLLRPWFQTRR